MSPAWVLVSLIWSQISRARAQTHTRRHLLQTHVCSALSCISWVRTRVNNNTTSSSSSCRRWRRVKALPLCLWRIRSCRETRSGPAAAWRPGTGAGARRQEYVDEKLSRKILQQARIQQEELQSELELSPETRRPPATQLGENSPDHRREIYIYIEREL